MKPIRKAIVALAGGTVLALGVAMLVLPGPAIVVIPCGLAILATEFVWAERALAWCRSSWGKVRESKPWTRWAGWRRARC